MDKWKIVCFIIIAFIVGYWFGNIVANHERILYIGSNEIKYESAFFGVLLDPNK